MRLCSFAVSLFAVMVLAATAFGQHGPSAEPQKAGTQTGVLRIPPGTILPIRLNHGFSSKNARAGQPLSARIMQAVPLAGGETLPGGAKVSGTIVAVTSAGANWAGSVSFRFRNVAFDHKTAEITANLRALASFMEAELAQVPETPAGFGTPYNWTTTGLIGGGQKYGVDGPVTDGASQIVGKGTKDGVLVEVRAQNGSPCHADPEGQRRLQALWVFSSDACGVYGMEGVKIVHAGRTEPVGEIALASEVGDVKVRAGATMLLRVR